MITEEVYDVIDPQGKTIGTATWTEVHTQGLLHKIVHGILFKDESKKMVLFKKRTLQSVQEPGKLEIAVGGHVLAGESPELSIERELNEELFGDQGLPENLVIKKVGAFFNHDFVNNNEIATLFEMIHPGPFQLEKGEVDQMIWLDWEELIKDIKVEPAKYAQYSINAIEAYLEKTNSGPKG